MGEKAVGFRGWYYFRMGWSTYFAFIFAAINTLTVTYYLAIEKIPALESIFPSFINYVVIITGIGIPILILIGYAHWKRTPAFRSEVEISYEADPFRSRILSNSEITVKINLKLMEIMLRVSRGEKIPQEEIDKITELKNELSEFVEGRVFRDRTDLAYFKNNLDKFKI
tara:strand:- start:423 stop:929 length:507 start_codon:yes stop_codon:yes gene_type:complete